MVWYITWEREYEGDGALSSLDKSFYQLGNALESLGHKVESKEFDMVKTSTRNTAYMEFLLADCIPLVVAYISATRGVKSGSGKILLGVRHFSGPDRKFPKLEEIAENYGLRPNKIFESFR